MSPISISIIGFLAAPGATLVRLWLRLQWQARQEDARQRALLALSATMPRFSQIDETRSDGSRVRVTIAGAHNCSQAQDVEERDGRG